MHLKLDSPIRYIFLSSLQTSSLQLYNYQWFVLFSEGFFWLIFSLFEQKNERRRFVLRLCLNRKMNVADLFFVSVWTEKWTSQICSSSLFELLFILKFSLVYYLNHGGQFSTSSFGLLFETWRQIFFSAYFLLRDNVFNHKTCLQAISVSRLAFRKVNHFEKLTQNGSICFSIK